MLISLSCGNHCFPFPSIERDGWYKFLDVFLAIWNYLFLTMVMLCTLVPHCVLKEDKKFDSLLSVVIGAASHPSNISYVLTLCHFPTWHMFSKSSFFFFNYIYSWAGFPAVFGLTVKLSNLFEDSHSQTCSVYCLACFGKCHTELAPELFFCLKVSL